MQIAPTVLILSVPGDVHASAVNWALHRHGVQSEIVFLSEIPDFSQITINVEAGSADMIIRNRHGVEIHTADVKVVWNRRVALPGAPHEAHKHDRDVIREACKHHINNFRAVLARQAIFINPPESQVKAQNKALQLLVAHAAGLSTPTTCVTNDFDRALDLVSAFPKSVMKMYYSRIWKDGNSSVGAFTTSLNALRANDRKAVELCPVIFQEAIQYDYEVRLIAFGEDIHAMKMDNLKSTADNDSHQILDGRLLLQYGSLSTSKAEVPDHIRLGVYSYLQQFGLNYGAFDFLVDKDDRWIFLECNEAGQFLFLEDEVPELPLLNAFASWVSRLAKANISNIEKISLLEYYRSRDFSLAKQERNNYKKVQTYAPFIDERQDISTNGQSRP